MANCIRSMITIVHVLVTVGFITVFYYNIPIYEQWKKDHYSQEEFVVTAYIVTKILDLILRPCISRDNKLVSCIYCLVFVYAIVNWI